jgi:hypothetical protein
MQYSNQSQNSNLKQQPIDYYLTSSISTKFNDVNEDIMDKHLTSDEKIDVLKTVLYNFFNDNTFFLSYYIKLHKIPPYEEVCSQFGFSKCRDLEERLHLLMLYKTCFEKCYPDLFVFKPLGILYQYFCEDRIADFILHSYGRIQYTDSHFFWFLERQDVVKHNQEYESYMEKKQRLFPKKMP